MLGTGRANRVRPDLHILGLGRTDFAFRFAVKVERASLVRVLVAGSELAGSPIAVGPGIWDGVLEITAGAATGWVTERCVASKTAPLIDIVDEQGEQVGQGRAVLHAPAVDTGFAPAPFSIPLPDRCFGRGETRYFGRINGNLFAETWATLGLDGFLDFISPERCAGWLLSPDAPERNFEIELRLDGRLHATVLACRPREDLKTHYPRSWRSGFEVTLSCDEVASQLCEVSLRLSGSNSELFDGPFVVARRPGLIEAARRVARLAHDASTRLADCDRTVLQIALRDFIEKQRRSSEQLVIKSNGTAPATPDITIIIPVYRDIDVTRDCIASVLRCRSSRHLRVLVVNDCSPDPGMSEMLAALEKEDNFRLLTNNINKGFIGSVNRALAVFPNDDVVLLNSDTRVFAGWLDEMAAIACSSADIGTVTALSNNATIFSYPHPTKATATLKDVSWEEVAAVALRENAGNYEDVPTGHGFCLFIKRVVLDRVGYLDERYGRGYGEENHLCALAADLGYRNVAATGVVVEHRESVSFGGERVALWERNRPLLEAAFPEYTPQIMAYELRDEVRRGRWPLDRYRLAKAHHAGRAFALIVRNWLGGGCDTAIRDLRGTIDPRYALLSLSAREDGFVVLTAEEPVLMALFAPGDEAELIALLQAANVRLVIAHQLLGFSPAFLEAFTQWAETRPSICYLHDFYALCPRVTLIDATQRHCGLPEMPVCERCVLAGGAHEASRAKGSTVAEHRALFGRLLGRFGRLITPSENAAGYLRRVFPALAIDAIPHPQTLWQFPATTRAGSFDDIVLLGAIGSHKGSGALLDIARNARLTHPHLRFHVIGYTNVDEQLAELTNVSVSGEYDPADLPRLIANTEACLALFLHGWPETFSYALSEVVAAGLIPLVPDIGAPAERVRKAGFGAVYPFPFDSRQVLAAIDAVAAGQQAFDRGGRGPPAFETARECTKTTQEVIGALIKQSQALQPPRSPKLRVTRVSRATAQPATRESL
ncbi:MAG: glycosyltransferase [Alphaproteobacteria bacterium]|nr:glycosyltransferase [Alphaproteobacteria bacterium]